MAISDFYSSAAVTHRKQVTSDGIGGESEVWTQNLASYKCRIKKGSGRITLTEIGKQVPTTHTMDGEVADVKAGDKLVIGSNSYLVLSIHTSGSPITSHHMEASLQHL